MQLCIKRLQLLNTVKYASQVPSGVIAGVFKSEGHVTAVLFLTPSLTITTFALIALSTRNKILAAEAPLGTCIKIVRAL